MNFTRLSKKFLSLALTVAMLLSLCAPTITVVAEGVEDSTADNKLNYVSIGDSMTNGYGFDGYNQGNKDDLNGDGDYTNEYNFYKGENVYGEGSYALQFEDYLRDEGYDVTHTKLAASALRAEDLLYLLGGREMPTDGWFEQVLYYTDAGENGKWDDAGDRDPEAIEKLSNHYVDAITDADVMTLCIGNASFGAYLLSRVSSILMGGTLAENEMTDLEDALALLESEEAKEIVLDVYADMKAELEPYMSVAGFDAAQLEAALGILAYTTAGFLLNYEAVLDRIVELNPDVTIILIGLMNTTYGMTVTGEGFEFEFGAMMDNMFGMLNAYIAGIPAAKQLSGEYSPKSDDYYYVNVETGEIKYDLTLEERLSKTNLFYGTYTWQEVLKEGVANATFYYAEQPNPEFIVQAFDDLYNAGWNNIDCGNPDCTDCTSATGCPNGRLSGAIVRSRQIDAYNGELRLMIGAAFGMELPAITLADVANYTFDEGDQ